MIQNIISLSETGLRRLENQDAIFADNTENAGLFVIADGMGGHYKGELASQTAVCILEKWWKEIRGCIAAMPFADAVSELEAEVFAINKNIYQMYCGLGQLGGTTLCLLFIQGGSYAVVNVGDSRLYCCNGRNCALITSDDVSKDAQDGGLTQAVGVQESLIPHIFIGTIIKKTYFFICSDGIYKYCGERYLLSKLRSMSWKSGTAVTGKIRERVYRNGAGDNLSMLLVSVCP